MSEDPKAVLRKIAEAERQQKLRDRQTRLSEDRPDEIVMWCHRALRLTPVEAAAMTSPLAKLDYGKLDDQVVELVENTLRYVVTGERCPAGHPED